MRFISTLLAALPLAVAAPVIEERQAPTLGRYIVVLKPEATESVLRDLIVEISLDLTPDFVYNIGSFKGFAAPLSEALLTTITSLSSVSQPASPS